MLRYLFFDLYGTLVDIETDEASPHTAAAFERYLGDRYGPAAADREREHPLLQDFRGIVVPDRPHAEPDIAPVVATHLQGLLDRVPSPDEVLQVATAFRVASRRRFGLLPGVLLALEQLARDYPLGLISNAQELFTLPELEAAGLGGRFWPQLISSQVGVRKPGGEIFARALERARVPAAEALYVGNDPHDDVGGAAAAGMQTCLVGSAPLIPGAAAPSLRLASVADLPAALRGDAQVCQDLQAHLRSST